MVASSAKLVQKMAVELKETRYHCANEDFKVLKKLQIVHMEQKDGKCRQVPLGGTLLINISCLDGASHQGCAIL